MIIFKEFDFYPITNRLTKVLKYIKYFRYLIRHKFYLFVVGLKLKVPIWQLIVHDYSKLFPSILKPYANSVEYGYNYKNWPQKAKDDFDLGCLRHFRIEKHHFQAWVLFHDSGCLKALEIPDNYLRELLADWLSAGKAKTGKWEAKSWYSQRKDKIILHPNTRRKLEELLERF